VKKVKNKRYYTKFEELPETITPIEYSEWRGIGENKAREIFNSKGFPKIQGMGTKLIADKRAVLLHELGLDEESKKELVKELAKAFI
jgi:hypothetical protein